MSINLKILMISPQFRPLVGGYERAAERLSKALAGLGLEIVVVSERRNRNWLGYERLDGFVIQRLNCWYRRYFHSMSSMLSLAKYLLMHGRQFSIWHVHQYGSQAALAVVLGYCLHKPVVLKLTNSLTMGINESLGGGAKGFILNYWHRQVGACIAISRETYAEAIAFGIPAERVHLIPNGVDGDQFYPATAEERASARQNLGIACRKMVLFVGRLSPEKNLPGLVDAWSALTAGVLNDALLVIVGDGSDRSVIEQKIQLLGLTQSIYLAGNQTDVGAWYRAADIYVISSYNEGLSNTMLEALASGLPIISTRVSGSSILLENDHAGVVVDIDNAKQLTEAMSTLLQDASLRNRLAKNARQLFELHFSMSNLAKRTILLYQQLLGQTPHKELS